MSNDEFYKKIGERIKALRKARGFSQETLAGECNIDRAHIGFIEQGRRRPTLSTLRKIVAALDVPLSKFFADL